MKHMFNRVISLILIVTLTLPLAQAVAPAPKRDETLYVTLNPYGAAREFSVVKRYAPNGAAAIIDYGVYQSIINMSDESKPIIGKDGTVTFQLGPTPPSRFYFEGKLKAPPCAMPWTLDVRYRLNGVDTPSEKLAGAKGLVEIIVHAIPNPNASEYFKNNMLLQLATIVDDDVLSVEAPGAQVQSVGSKTAILFLGMPAEDREFIVRIGTEDFSFSGFVAMMVPATLGQLSDLNDLRKAKTDIEDSANAASAGLDVILSTLNGMQRSLDSTADGIAGLDQARSGIASGKGDLYAKADTALADLTALSNALAPLPGHLDTAKGGLSDTHKQLGKLVDTVSSLRTELSDTRDAITKFQKDAEKLQDALSKLDALDPKRRELVALLLDDLEEVQTKIDLLSLSLRTLRDLAQNIPTIGLIDPIPCDELESLIAGYQALQASGMSNEQILAYLAANNPTAAALFPAYLSGQLALQMNTIDTLNGVIADVNKTIGTVNATLSTLGLALSNICSTLSALCEHLGKDGSFGQDCNDAIDLLNQYLNVLNDQNATASDLLTHANQVGDILTRLTDKGDTMIGDIEALRKIADNYEPRVQTALTEMQTAMNRATKGMNSARAFLTALKNLLQTNGKTLDTGTQKTLAGLISVLRKSTAGLAQTGVLQNAKNIIKNTIDDKWDEYTGEKSNLLNLDPDATPVSFTSEQNVAPQSIQIILRTDSITKDEDENTPPDQDESFHAEGNVFTRIWNICKELYHAIKSVFVK